MRPSAWMATSWRRSSSSDSAPLATPNTREGRLGCMSVTLAAKVNTRVTPSPFAALKRRAHSASLPVGGCASPRKTTMSLPGLGLRQRKRRLRGRRAARRMPPWTSTCSSSKRSRAANSATWCMGSLDKRYTAEVAATCPSPGQAATSHLSFSGDMGRR
jgi:hypothetical protein